MANADGPDCPAASDASWMQAALRLAERGLGKVWPNPAVGCILVQGHEIVGRGVTQPGGRPHAEAEALRAAGSRARGATAYVSLEPCAHFGMTPPCADAMIEAGVVRAVIAVEDPDPRVSGRGIARLRAGGVRVDTPLLPAEAAALNAGFFLKMRAGRPLFTLKLATSLDGRIATATGESRWITSADARAIGHRLRASHDAVLVGSGTALVDDAELTCRLPGLAHQSPLRIVLDRRLRLSSASRLATTATRHRVWLLTRPEADAERRARLTRAGVVVMDLPMPADDVAAARLVARHLAALGLTRVLIEGGAVVAAAFLAAGLIDDIWLMQAPSLLGGDGIAALAPFGLVDLAAAPRFQRIAAHAAGADWIAVYQRRT